MVENNHYTLNSVRNGINGNSMTGKSGMGMGMDDYGNFGINTRHNRGMSNVSNSLSYHTLPQQSGRDNMPHSWNRMNNSATSVDELRLMLENLQAIIDHCRQLEMVPLVFGVQLNQLGWQIMLGVVASLLPTDSYKIIYWTYFDASSDEG